MMDRAFKFYFGPENDLKYITEHGSINWPKKVQEAYWRWYVDVRVPVYMEHISEITPHIKEHAKKAGVELDWQQFDPLISYYPPIITKELNNEFDLYCFSYRDGLHTGSSTMEQPWIDEASSMNPYTYTVTMDRGTGEKKGLKDGDTIEIESPYGRKVQGTLKLTEAQHPQTVAIAACSGHWAKGQPVARGKGANFDDLLELDLKHVDPVSLNIETAVRVKVRKIAR
jgi:anaerobic selenocysteine-containing dehydrogenase